MKKWVIIIWILAVVCLMGCALGEGAASSIPVGSIVTFGRYEQDGNRVNGPEPIEWIVLGGQGSRALLLSRYGLETKPFHEKRADITWEQCTLRAWLNADFISTAFNEQEQAAILTTHVDNSDAQMYQGYSYTITTSGNDTEDRIFLLSYYEAFQVYFSDARTRRCAPTDYAIGSGSYVPTATDNRSWATWQAYKTEEGRESGKWWLRTSGVYQTTANYVDADGGSASEAVEGSSFRDGVCVRPAMWIDLGAGTVNGGGTGSAELTAGPAGDETDVPVTGDIQPGEPTAAPAAGETVAPLTGEYLPTEPTWAPQPIETAPPAEQTRAPQPIETARPVEQTWAPWPEETARPAEPTQAPQPIETARPAEQTWAPWPEETAQPVEPTQAPSNDKTNKPAFDGTPYYETFSPDWWPYYVAPSETDIRIVTFGRYEQDNNPDNGMEPIEWIVLEERDGKALVLSRYGLDTRPYNTEDVEVTWETCSARAWLNDDFLNTAFNTEEQKSILLTEVDNSDSQGYTASMSYGEGDDEYVEEWIAPGGNNTQDYIFLLSFHEAFEQYCTSYETRMCVPTEFALSKGAETSEDSEERFRMMLDGRYTGEWWLRSLGESCFDATYVIDYGGPETITVNYDGRMIRPAMWITLDSETKGPAEGTPAVPGPVDETPAIPNPPAETAGTDVKVGSIVVYGRYEQDNHSDNGAEPIEWIVLDVQGGKALLLSKCGLDVKPYNTEEREGLKWENCSLRAWLNSEFMNAAFTGDEQKSILLTDVGNVDDSKYIGGMPGDGECLDMPLITGDNTQDYLFLLSFHEAYDLYIKDVATRKCYPTEYLIANVDGLFPGPSYTYWPALWWVRTTVSFDTESFAGYIWDDGVTYDYGGSYSEKVVVRPAMWVSLETGMITPAETPAVTNPPAETAGTDVKVGSIVTYGSYEQDNHSDNGPEPIEWIVLDVQAGKALLLSKYGLAYKAYHTEEKEITWENCSLRAWLNSDFMNAAFTGKEQQAIVNAAVNNGDSSAYSGFIPYDEDGMDMEFEVHANGGNNTVDRVFLLSCYEAFEVYFKEDEARICSPTDYAAATSTEADISYPQPGGPGITGWWLRSTLEDGSAAFMLDDGSTYSFAETWEGPAVRPAMWVDLNADIF